jgi:drug/metabolite transporter (DMT)-like permease
MLIAHFFLHDDKMTVPKVVGLLIGFAGVVILLSKDIGDSLGSLLGQFAVVLACIFYSGSDVFARRTTENIPGILRSAGPLISGTGIMWLATSIFERPVHIPQMAITWVALLFLGVLGSGLAFVMSYYLLHEIGPTRTNMVTYLYPVGGVLLGVIFLHEPLTWQLIAGSLLVIASLAVVNWKQPSSHLSVQTEK